MNTRTHILARWRAEQCSPATAAIVQWWLSHAPPDRAETLARCAALLQIRQEAGDVAVELANWYGKPLPSADLDAEPATPPADDLLVPNAEALQAASGEPWLGDGSQPCLLVVRNGLLLSWRQHQAELTIIQALRTPTSTPQQAVSIAQAAPSITALFHGDAPQLPSAWQRVAVATVIHNRAQGRRLSIVTGGPGTGKTTTMARLLAVLLMHDQVAPERIRICAPTGKAADRLAGSLRSAVATKQAGKRDDLAGCPAAVRARIPTTASTIHTLLGYNPARGRLRHDHHQPLPADLVILDEASMVDPILLAALLDALPATAHLVLVGDPHQLTSVASGCVLADLCALTGVDGGYDPDSIAAFAPLGVALPAAPKAPILRGVACALTHNHRSNSAHLSALAIAVLGGNADAATAAANHPGSTALANGSPQEVINLIRVHARRVQACGSVDDALKTLREFQVLCAQRHGPWGAQTIAAAVDGSLGADRRSNGWYPGRAVLITANDRARGLMNGDIGLCWSTGNQLRIHVDRPGQSLSFSPADLPSHASAWAMTIHKSQGSEYDQVQVILPSTADHALNSRELLYTAITRAKNGVRIWADAAVFTAAVKRNNHRRSGLAEICLSAPALSAT